MTSRKYSHSFLIFFNFFLKIHSSWTNFLTNLSFWKRIFAWVTWPECAKGATDKVKGHEGLQLEVRQSSCFLILQQCMNYLLHPKCSYIGKLNLIKIFHCLSFNFAHKSFCNFTSLLYNCSFVSKQVHAASTAFSFTQPNAINWTWAPDQGQHRCPVLTQLRISHSFFCFWDIAICHFCDECSSVNGTFL